jgi:transposase InsO family protein
LSQAARVLLVSILWNYSKARLQRLSRKGNCYDNAAMESFWSALKRELVYQRRFATRGEARAAIFEWIEVFYNRVRLHSALGFQSPVEL